MGKKRFCIFISIVLLAIIILGACSDSESTSETSSSGSEDITIGVSANFVSMDPHDTNDTLGYSVQKGVLEGLVGFDKDMNVIPKLALEFEANDEATEFDFILREDVEFHDGTPFNAEAVKANIDRLADPSNNLKRHSMVSAVDEVIVVDEFHVKVILKEPFGAQINNFAHPSVMMHSPKSLEENGKDVGLHPVGTGPFKFKEWNSSDEITIEKNDDYWRNGYPKVDSITFKPVPENGSRIAMLQTGEADFIYPVPTEQAESIGDEDGIEVVVDESIVTQYFSMNTLKEPYSDVRVRQAINYAIDKDAFVNVVLDGFGTPLDSIVAPKVQYYSPQTTYDYDLDKAKELLAEAGYSDGFETTIWSANSSSAIKASEFIQQQLALIDVEVEVVPMESGTLSDSLWDVEDPHDAKVELYYGGWSSSTGDADWGLRPLIGGEENYPPYSYNVAFYNNAEVNDYIQQALSTANSDKRQEVYEKAQEIIWDEAPWAFLALTSTMAGKKENLEGIYLLPDNSLSFDDIEVK